MLRSLSDRTSSLLFLGLVLVAAVIAPSIADGLVLALSPLLVTLLMLLVVTREGWTAVGWHRTGITRLGLRWWPATLIATAGVSILATTGAVLLGAGVFSSPAPDTLSTLLSLCITGPILALGEELGWRGYLQPRLASWLGSNGWASFVIGVVWAAWHLPYILMTTVYHGAGDRGPVLMLFAASVIAFSMLFGLLRARSDSVWPAVLAHFAHNATFAWFIGSFVTASNPVLLNEYLSGDTGLLVLIGTLVATVAIAVTTSPASRARAAGLPEESPSPAPAW